MTVTTDGATLATYADDTLIASAHTNVNISIATLHQNIDGLAAWFNKWKLALDTTKTETKIFTLRKIPHNIIRIHMNQIPVAWTPTDTSIKYLGLHADK